MRRSGVRSPSAPPANILIFDHLQETDTSEPKIIWRDIDVAEQGFLAGGVFLPWTSMKKA